MKRWKLGLVGLSLAAAAAVGCKQRLYITEKDIDHYKELAVPFGAPPNLENDPTAAILPNKYAGIPEPPTVDTPDRKIREISLQECIAIALEQGNTGSQSALFPGIANDNISASPRGGTFSDSIRVLALDPAIAGADIEASLSKFDARFLTSMTWNKQDQGIINRFSSNADTAEFATGFYKPLPTGGLAGITFQTDYQKLNLVPNQANIFTLSTSYRPRLMFQFEQPLLQNYGIDINQLLTSHPGTIQGVPGTQQALRLGGGRVEGILITRLRYEGAKADFEKNVNYMLLNVEYAYWNLYASYGALYARDRALVDALVLFRVVENRFKGGGVAGALPQDVARAQAQLETFRAQRLGALGDVFEKERQLRSLLGMQYDGTRLVPRDKPVLAGYAPDWQTAIDEAMVNRPELTLARHDLKFRQFDLMVQKNSLKPNLVFTSDYDINGVGRRLDGSTTEFTGQIDQTTGLPATSPRNAFASLANNKFNSWGAGLRLDIPLGFRDAHSAVRVARLNLVRSYASMRDSERKVIDELRVNWSRLAEYRMEIQANRAAGQASAEHYRILSSRREIDPLATLLEAMLNAQQTRAAAETAEYTAIANYNNTLAGWQFSKGTILQYDNVMIGDGALPQAVQVRAADHIRERQVAQEIREHPTEEHTVPGAYALDADPARGVLPATYDPAPDVPGMLRSMSQPDRIPSVPAQNLPSFGGAAVPTVPPPITPK
jgi:outer membrane protein TolC